jgi:hypothetical protein
MTTKSPTLRVAAGPPATRIGGTDDRNFIREVITMSDAKTAGRGHTIGMLTNKLTMNLVADAALIIVGLVLLLFFRDSEFWWFRGQPLGIVLLILGVIGVATAAWDAKKPERR